MSVTPSQTVGPYFQIGLIHERWSNLTGAGERIAVEGSVLDAEGAPVTDAMIEIWQPDNKAFGRFATDPTTGRFAFEVSRPVSMAPDAAPHLCVGVFARGLLKRLYTRIYFDPAAINGNDPTLSLVPYARRPTLIAVATDDRHYRFDIRLAGNGETVFFEC